MPGSRPISTRGEGVVRSAVVSKTGNRKVFCEQLLQWGAESSACLRHMFLMDASHGNVMRLMKNHIPFQKNY